MTYVRYVFYISFSLFPKPRFSQSYSILSALLSALLFSSLLTTYLTTILIKRYSSNTVHIIQYIDDINRIEDEDEVDEFGRKQTIVASAVSRHETFFSCVQAACYIVCFYGVEIANAQRNVRTTQKRWQKVLTCTLQPLRFCLQSVRVEFLRLAVQTNMCDDSCWESLPPDVLPNFNQNTPKKKVPGNVNMGAGFNPLDSFFPYDPCLLRMLHQPVENYYRVWRGVPGLDDVTEVEAEVVLDESRIVDDESTLEMSMMGGDVSMAGGVGDVDGDVMVRSRGSSVCSDSGSDSGESRSLSSSMHMHQHHSEGMDVCMAVSMTVTESLGIGLLAEKEREMEKHRERGRGLDSRAQSMVSDCSLEDDRSHSISLSPHGHNGHTGHDVHSPVFRALSNSSLPHVPSFTQFTSLMGGNNNNNPRDLGDPMDEGTPYKGVSGVGVAHLADGGWPVPERRPRQYSVGSTGSW